MKSILCFSFIMFFIAATTAGCRTQNGTFSGTENKNIDMSGYVMYSKVQTADSSTGTPVGKIIMGRVNYKSRKVGIPADQKIPFTGNFKSTRTKTIFGTEEHIVEYDFTADNSSDAAAAAGKLEDMKEKVFSNTQEK